MARGRKRSGKGENDDFLAMPMYRLVDRHRAILEEIKSPEDAEYWGHMLIGEYYPDVPTRVRPQARWRLSSALPTTWISTARLDITTSLRRGIPSKRPGKFSANESPKTSRSSFTSSTPNRARRPDR